MKVLIIEDEYPSALRLQKMLSEVESNIEVLKVLDSVEKSVEYINNHEDIDLLFMDIHLTDGLGLDILKKIDREIPVIITTAYDQYALDAYKYLSVDYLLKPIKESDLKRSLSQYRQNFEKRKGFDFSFEDLQGLIKPNMYKSKFICRRGKNRYPIHVDQISCFFAEDRETWLITMERKEFHIQKTLEQLENELDPNLFFRASRKVICAKKAVEKFEMLMKSKVKLFLQPPPTFDVIISSEKSASFKKWIMD